MDPEDTPGVPAVGTNLLSEAIWYSRVPAKENMTDVKIDSYVM